MKTTLKRGYGRGAAVNGNGHGTLPPAARPQITRYSQPPPPRRGGLAILGRFLLGTLLLVLMVGLGLAGGAYLYFHQSVSAVQAHTADVKKAAKQLDIPLANHAAIALVVGYDHRMGLESAGPSRSDTMMLLRADPVTKTISMLSFPRDLLVEQYCPGKTADAAPVPQGQGKINGAYAICGASGSLLTVKELTGLPINYLITVDFHGFKEVVDRVHGVWMDIDRRYYNKNVGTAATDYANIDLEPGYQRLNGQQALDFVRFRHTDSDFYRLARQQEFVKALKQQISTSLSVTDLPRIVSAITDNVEVGEGGGRAISGSTVLSYALFAYELPPGHFFQDKIDNLGQDAYYNVTASPQAIQQAVEKFQNPDVGVSRQATAAALGQKLKTKTPAAKDTNVYVLNGNGVPGAAANAAYSLSQRGYRILTSSVPANAPSQVFKTKIYYAAGNAKAKAAAKPMANLFAPADVARMPADIRGLAPPGTMLAVVVGQTFHGELAPPASSATPITHQPAFVRYDAGIARDLVAHYARKLGFPAMNPTVVERNSNLPSDTPVRFYTIQGHHKALRLVFQSGPFDYWGIEETDWKDAPILAKPSETRKLKDGRTYDLYYTGSHLTMVVLHGPGDARYWVTNSLLSTLSNETMIAIAKGLQPLGK